MIRARRPADLDRLSTMVAKQGLPRDVTPGASARAWLEVDVAERSWVFDMAPAHVTPTGNVVGHVQVYRPTRTSSTPDLAACARLPVDDLLAIGRLVVEPQAHDYGIARHLLKQSRTYIQERGATAVLDLYANGYLTRGFCERYGFVGLPSPGPDTAPMIHAG